MENATKALIIAAEVLIGLMILSLAVYLFVTFGQTAKEVDERNAETQLLQFNEQYATYLGLGQKTGIELPNESAGELASKETAEKHGVQWYAGDVLSAAIGQTYNNFTPLQMVRYTSVIANGGKSIKPTIVKSIIKADGTEVPKEEVEQFVNNKLGYTPTEENYQFKEEYIKALKNYE